MVLHGIDSLKVMEVGREHHVCVAYANPDDQIYVSVSGAAQISRDRQKIEELWNPAYKAWFPKGSKTRMSRSCLWIRIKPSTGTPRMGGWSSSPDLSRRSPPGNRTREKGRITRS